MTKTTTDNNASITWQFINDHINNIVNADDGDTAQHVLIDIITDVRIGQFKNYNQNQQQKLITEKKELTETLLNLDTLDFDALGKQCFDEFLKYETISHDWNKNIIGQTDYLNKSIKILDNMLKILQTARNAKE